MNVLIVDGYEVEEEFKLKFNGDYATTFIEGIDLNHDIIEKYDVIFDFGVDESPENLGFYEGKSDKFVFISTPKIQLAELIYHYGEVKCKLFGFNGLPTFINREFMEVSLLKETEKSALDYITKELNSEYLLIDDRVGMVTPRVIFMIINEACFTLQEGTASIKDIDLGMKLGTNYPKGPFEWCNQIGIHHVFETLESVYEDTKDERYKICPLLKTKYLKGEEFEL